MSDLGGDFGGGGDTASSFSTSSLLGAGGGLIGGLGSLFGGLGAASADQAEAQGFGVAAQYAQQNAYFSGEAGGLQNLAEARKIQHVQGAQAAAAAANGLQGAGSALSMMRDTTQQGALAEGQIGLQTAINVTNYEGQSASDLALQSAANAAASAATTSGIFGLLGGVVGAAAKLFL